MEAKGYRFRGADQDGDLVFWGPLRSELVLTVSPAGVVGVQEIWPGTQAQARARYRVVADSLRRVHGRPNRSEDAPGESSVAWERDSVTLTVAYGDRGVVRETPRAEVRAHSPGYWAEIERRSDLERAENERIASGEQPRDTLLVGDWMRVYSDGRYLTSFDSAGTVRVSPGVYRTRIRDNWMFTRRLENGILYNGEVRTVEIDCQAMRERRLSFVPFYGRKSSPTVVIPPAQRRWSTPAATSPEGRAIRRACQLSGAGRG
ncbi:MAG TPA: hypothetical protein VFS20_17145 [Longimicrobium sp.]|nr:hypothetical protein [Longimicrobium sp.]